MMSGSPRDVFENSSHWCESGSLRDLSGHEASCFSDGLSFVHLCRFKEISQIFFWGTTHILARAGPCGEEWSHILRVGAREHPAASHHPELDSRRPSLRPLNLSRPETRESSTCYDLPLGPGIEAVQNSPRASRPDWSGSVRPNATTLTHDCLPPGGWIALKRVTVRSRPFGIPLSFGVDWPLSNSCLLVTAPISSGLILLRKMIP